MIRATGVGALTFWICLTCGCSAQPAGEPSAVAAPSSSTPSSSVASESALDGTYVFFADNARMTVNGEPRAGGVASSTTWDITACGAACGHVTSSLGWSTELHLIDGSWRARREVPLDCGGGAVTSSLTYVLDAETLTGTVTKDVSCGTAPNVVVVSATLTKP